MSVGVVDKERVAVSGGSHGGFLTGNLLGRHADRFKAGLARNPVMDLSLMIHVSDIPDWCYVEAFGVQVGLAPPPTFPHWSSLLQIHCSVNTLQAASRN